jgi:hypothetical protein
VVYDTKEVPSELVVNEVKRSEMEGSGVVYYAHELPSNMETAELDGKAIESRSVKRSSGGK